MKQRSLWAIIVATILMTSCLGIDSQASIGSDGVVDATLVYTVSVAVDELGKLGANAAYIPLPVGREDLDLAARRAGGELRSWSRKDGTESFAVSASMRFPTVSAFASFLDPAGTRASYSESGGRSTLSMRLSDGVAPADKDLLEFIRVAFSDYVIAVSLTTPRAPSASEGFTVSGRTATFSMKAADLYASEGPVTLSLAW
jgi:hypothetical protein